MYCLRGNILILILRNTLALLTGHCIDGRQGSLEYKVIVAADLASATEARPGTDGAGESIRLDGAQREGKIVAQAVITAEKLDHTYNRTFK